jgi:hypothetical protein
MGGLPFAACFRKNRSKEAHHNKLKIMALPPEPNFFLRFQPKNRLSSPKMA